MDCPHVQSPPNQDYPGMITGMPCLDMWQLIASYSLSACSCSVACRQCPHNMCGALNYNITQDLHLLSGNAISLVSWPYLNSPGKECGYKGGEGGVEVPPLISLGYNIWGQEGTVAMALWVYCLKHKKFNIKINFNHTQDLVHLTAIC